MRSYPNSLAIAGAWGYIGRKFLDAARRRRIPTLVFDPGDIPQDLEQTSFERITDPQQFYASQSEWFHLAMHPQHRQAGLEQLLARAATGEDIAVLNEKPLVAPENPEQCQDLVQQAEQAEILMLFDFPELFDPLTERIIEYLKSFREVRITDIYLCRSKDRESPHEPRNFKPMVPIQYQESVHCLAFLIYLLAKIHGDTAAAFQHGVTVRGQAAAYRPPNPQIYPHVVDGRCHYHLGLGPLSVEGQTDFKAGADTTKQRILSGMGDGKPLQVEVDYQEGRKRLVINGMDRTMDPAANSYDNVLRTMTRWRRSETRQHLMNGVYPNPTFARITYQLSSVLWRACYDKRSIHLESLDDLLAFDAAFAQAKPTLPRYE